MILRSLFLQLVLVTAVVAEEKPFTMLTDELLAQLPEAKRAQWTSHISKSREAAASERRILAEECQKAGMEKFVPAPGNRKEFEFDSDTPAEWFGSTENQKLAEIVISYQTPTGGWSKAVDYSQGPRQPGTHWTAQKGDAWHYCGTFDNRTTTEQLKFLAGVFTATKREDVKAALLKGLDYVFAAQYPNGGWPQNYPIERGYHEAITLNDDAMVHVLELLLAVAKGEKLFAFADDTLKQRARAAFDKGVSNIVAMQVKIDGTPTVWCAQHHPLTLAPVKARAKEPPSLSGGESANLVKFLMRSGPTTPEVVAAVDSAMKWFESHKLTGLRKSKTADGKTDYIDDPACTDVIWSRFYDLKTGKPIFAGAEDGIVYPTFHEMAVKNKVAYDFFSTRPKELMEKESARWKQRLEKAK
ncbi:pectate lyase [Prosthecobacter fluviatilis]|uniref:Pectate lyase n=1 Tax=Prosthecobacter fluviatilis TaxID=445931 RepID=A0ABW0KPP1_9BACT